MQLRARIARLDVYLEMFHDESWKPIYFFGQKKVTSHKNIVGVDLCTLVSVGFF